MSCEGFTHTWLITCHYVTNQPRLGNNNHVLEQQWCYAAAVLLLGCPFPPIICLLF